MEADFMVSVSGLFNGCRREDGRIHWRPVVSLDRNPLNRKEDRVDEETYRDVHCGDVSGSGHGG